MDKLNFGDIVLLKFPFIDNKTFKRRPALIINDFNDGDIIVCRITSQIYDTQNDLLIDDWKESGLKLPSVIQNFQLQDALPLQLCQMKIRHMSRL